MATKAKKSGARGLARIDQPSTRTHGWYVRVGYYRQRNGSYRARHVAFFGDATYGGKRKAQAAAEAFAARAHRAEAAAKKKPAARRKPAAPRRKR